MSLADGLERPPLSAEARQLLEYLLRRRREGDLRPPLVREAADDLELLPPAVRSAGEELHSLRLAVLADPGLIAPIRWPRLGLVAGRGFALSLAEELSAVGVQVSEELAARWEAIDNTQTDGEAPDVPEPEPPAGGGDAADMVWLAIRAAYRGALPEALQACRRVTDASLARGTVPLLARMAGWLTRLLAAGQEPGDETDSSAGGPSLSQSQEARRHFQAGRQAELLRNRERAQAEYLAALQVDPAFDLARLHYARVTFDLGAAQQALRELARMIQARRGGADALLLQATMLLDLAEEDTAPEGWEEQVRSLVGALLQASGPHKAEARLLQARALLLAGKAEQALAAARGAIVLQPGRPEGYHFLGQAQTAEGDLVTAARAEACAVLADHEYTPAAEALFHLRHLPQVAQALPHARALIDETWQ